MSCTLPPNRLLVLPDEWMSLMSSIAKNRLAQRVTEVKQVFSLVYNKRYMKTT